MYWLYPYSEIPKAAGDVVTVEGPSTKKARVDSSAQEMQTIRKVWMSFIYLFALFLYSPFVVSLFAAMLFLLSK